jgi:cytochrome bd-type quinol oxidase subunit 1
MRSNFGAATEAVYSRFVGDVFGSALAAEGIFAFFLESGFLAVLVFGWDKVGPRFHFFAMVRSSFIGRSADESKSARTAIERHAGEG